MSYCTPLQYVEWTVNVKTLQDPTDVLVSLDFADQLLKKNALISMNAQPSQEFANKDVQICGDLIVVIVIQDTVCHLMAGVAWTSMNAKTIQTFA